MTRSFAGSRPFPAAAHVALRDGQLRTNLARATATIRTKRDRAVSELPDLEELRLGAESVKQHALSRLDELLVELETNVHAAGGHVHWARDAAEANAIVTRLVTATGEHELVKVKSMTTAEIGLNDALAAAGIDARETDLAELIVQLGDDLPSHIVVPAIHRNRAEIRSTFATEMGRHGVPAPDGLSDDPADLAGAARAHLRDRFLSAKVAVSGANFAVAESGSLVVVESEGNGRMCLTLAETLISVVGIDKVVPTYRDLEIFLQLLPR
ncbi:MAG: LUD domain-containing protein, partial [Acidimicrobiales bacterium]